MTYEFIHGNESAVEEACGHVAHEAYRALCFLLNLPEAPPWNDVPNWMAESTLDGVRAVMMGGADYTPQQNHENWMRHKISQGWRLGPVKDVEEKTHPSLVPYSELPEYERVKNRLFVNIVQAMLDSLQVETVP